MYCYFTDPGHGWLKVKRSELTELKIADKISSYSYVRGDYVYLEEDCDIPMFVEAKFENAQLSREFFKSKVQDRHTDRQSKIRSYLAYKK